MVCAVREERARLPEVGDVGHLLVGGGGGGEGGKGKDERRGRGGEERQKGVGEERVWCLCVRVL